LDFGLDNFFRFSQRRGQQETPRLTKQGWQPLRLTGSFFVLRVWKEYSRWMTVQAGDRFAVIKLGDRNFHQIVAEFESHAVKVNDLKEEEM
jgi:hypothetical protein